MQSTLTKNLDGPSNHSYIMYVEIPMIFFFQASKSPRASTAIAVVPWVFAVVPFANFQYKLTFSWGPWGYWGQFIPVCLVFERARTPRHFLLCKGVSYEEIVTSTVEHLKAPRQWPQGLEAITFVASMMYQACLFQLIMS